MLLVLLTLRVLHLYKPQLILTVLGMAPEEIIGRNTYVYSSG
jgi:hypothetical protein